MAIRLTETRLRQIIREEASRLTRSRKIREAYNGPIESYSAVGKTPQEIAIEMSKDRAFFRKASSIFNSTNGYDPHRQLMNAWLIRNYGVELDPNDDQQLEDLVDALGMIYDG
jgi:hypothetical protein